MKEKLFVEIILLLFQIMFCRIYLCNLQYNSISYIISPVDWNAMLVKVIKPSLVLKLKCTVN